jgi:hypothetical protein
MRTGFHRHADVELLLHKGVIDASEWRRYREQFQPLAIQHEIDLVAIAQTLYAVAVSLKSKLYLVDGVLREGVMNYLSTPRSERKLVEMLLLRQVRRKNDRIAAGRTGWAADSEAADFPHSREIPLQ